jgi:hypothetical protein
LSMTRAGRGVILLAALVAGSGAHCVKGNDPLSGRVEALEKRVAALEGAGDTSRSAPTDAATGSPDASLASGRDAAAAPSGSVEIDAGWSCAARARIACESRLRRGLLPDPADAGLAWRRVPSLDSPEGQRCQRERRAECESDEKYNREQREAYEQRHQTFFRWLDGHVTPNRIDAKLSADVQGKIVKALRDAGEAQPRVTVQCVPEFCRIELDLDAARDDLRSAAHGAIEWRHSSTGREDPTNPRRSTTYEARPGWIMPQPAGLSQRTRGSRIPPKRR